MMKKEIEKMITQALNIPIWQATKGVGSFLTFDMGDKITKKKRNGSSWLTGKIHLWIYLCDWVILSDSRAIAQSDSSDDEIATAVGSLIGRHIVSIRESETNRVEIEFSDKFLIILKNNEKTYADEDDFFILYTPRSTISYNMKTGFSSELVDSGQTWA